MVLTSKHGDKLGKSGQWKSEIVEKWRTILFHTGESGKGEEKNC